MLSGDVVLKITLIAIEYCVIEIYLNKLNSIKTIQTIVDHIPFLFPLYWQFEDLHMRIINDVLSIMGMKKFIIYKWIFTILNSSWN